MDTRERFWIGLSVLLMVTSTRGVVGAQPPPVAQELAETEVPRPEDPAVLALLETKPRTPLEWVRAAKILADLDRPDLAKGFLKQVLDANLDQQQLVALEGFFGAAPFTKMAARADLAPEAGLLNEAVLTAVRRHLEDPARLASLVGQLQDPSPEARYLALVELQRAGRASVGPLAAVLADPGRAAEHGNVRAALVRLGSDAVDPLIAILESGDPKLTAEAAGVLATLGAEKAIPFLLAPFASDESHPEGRQAAETALLALMGRLPSQQEAARLLARRAQEYFDRLQPLDEGLDGQVELWVWDGDAKRAVAVRRPADDASLMLASRLAREAFSVAPEDHQVRVLYLATLLEEAAYTTGLDAPVEVAEGSPAGRAAEFGPEMVEDVLVYALRTGHAPAATAAARVLGQVGAADTLLYQGPKPSPLVRATWDADRRVRFAAVEAILRLEPVQPYPGSSRVTAALLDLAASFGVRRALVAGPSTEETRRVGGYLAALGYQVDTAINGREAIRKLLASPDLELALVDAALERPTVDFLLQQLRHDCRTAKLPVGVIARAGQLERAKHLIRRDALALPFSRPHTQEAVLWQIERLMGLVSRDRVSADERFRQAAQAMRWLALLTGHEQRIYDFSRAQQTALAALLVPPLAPDAVAVLGNLGTPQSQQALVDLASRWTQPLELRLAAARAFRQSTERRGILLTSDQILLQYDRYNQSETMDTGTQQVLGLILDSIEAPTRLKQKKGSPAPDEPAG